MLCIFRFAVPNEMLQSAVHGKLSREEASYDSSYSNVVMDMSYSAAEG